MRLGEKIKTLRKNKNISQEIFASYLGVSFQAVSKWENGNTMPDISLIPAIASFFSVSIDELFDFNLFEIEKQVEQICNDAYKYRDTNKKKAQNILRDGLKRFPGNDIILNNLLYTLDYKTEGNEVINLCKTLIEATKDDSIKYDAYRILALCYKENRQYDLAKDAINKIPEIYFTKLELIAELSNDFDSYEAAQKQKNISAEQLINMLIIIAKYLKKQGDNENADLQLKIAESIIEAFKYDFIEDKWFNSTVYEYTTKQQDEIKELLNK